MLRTALPPAHTPLVGRTTRFLGAAGLALLVLASTAACGRRSDDSTIEDSDALALREIRAIQHLMLHLRRSDATVHGMADEPLSVDEAAAQLQEWLDDSSPRVRTADDFIAYVASSHPESGDPIELEFPDGTRERMGPWLSRDLLDYRHPKPDYEPPIPDLPLPDAEIRAALELVETSEFEFVVHTGPEGSVETVYDGLRFSRMLRRKWDWLGHGMQDFDEWLAEIGASSFKSTIPYEVELAPGNRVPFEAWLMREMARRAEELEQAKAAEREAQQEAEAAQATDDEPDPEFHDDGEDEDDAE